MTKLSATFPIGLVVNFNHTLDKALLKGKIDFLMVKVDGVGGQEYDPKLESHVQTAYDLDIPCGLMCYIDPALIDKNWPLADYSRWGKGAADPLFKKYMGLKTSKRNHFIVLHYHESKFYENGSLINAQWLTRIMNYEAEQFHEWFYKPVKDVAIADRKVIISASPETSNYLSDPSTGLKSWPSMSVVDGFPYQNLTWDSFREKLLEVDAPAVSLTPTRKFWWFDPYPSHNLPGSGNAGLCAFLGTKEAFYNWCQYMPVGTIPVPDPEPDPNPIPPDTEYPTELVPLLQAQNEKLSALLSMVEPISAFFARFR
ncbi:MAG: hypothetical protein HPY59_18065 [Anaerolineae bacterium]|nr:hypothetical protein [Anaerolineae bacterium]